MTNDVSVVLAMRLSCLEPIAHMQTQTITLNGPFTHETNVPLTHCAPHANKTPCTDFRFCQPL